MLLKEHLTKAILKKRGFTDAVLKKNEDIISSIKVENNNTVLIIESFLKHGEVYPALIHYLLELGYNVHLFRLEEHQKNESLCRTDFDNKRFKTFQFPIMPESDTFFELLNSYKYIFVTTLFTHDGYNFANALEKGFLEKYNKKNTFFIDHDFLSINNGLSSIEQRLFEQGKLFTLRDGIEILGHKIPFISPTWLGEYSYPEKKGKTHFICIGGGYQKNLRNFKLLFNSIDTLIQNGESNFCITFIGNTRDMLAEYLNEENEKYIKIYGFTDFQTLYKKLEESHFLIFNIDETCKEYNKYLKNGITGQYLLSLAFAKPAIILEDLAKAYKFDNCSIMYKENLVSALKNAIQLSQKDYKILQSKLEEKNNILQIQSIENLENYIPRRRIK